MTAKALKIYSRLHSKKLCIRKSVTSKERDLLTRELSDLVMKRIRAKGGA